jgi:shikimate kinase/3-dehydroquinate synthase
MAEAAFTNIIITGFMCSGKTSVGREVARRLGRAFVDMDERIAAHEGLSIPEIFSRYGEAYFRQRESEVSRELCRQTGLVIATGGGTLIQEQNRQQFLGSSFVVCLTCSVEQVLQRLGEDQDRPLLAGQDRQRRVEELLMSRQEAYGQLPHHVDTTGLTIEEVAGTVIKLYAQAQANPPRDPENWTELRVRTPRGGYSALLGNGLLARTGEALRRHASGGLVAVVTNPIVKAICGARVEESLRTEGFAPVVIEVPDGERYKTLQTVADLYDRFAAAELERSSITVALGGGVIGDLSGFAAATYMRGMWLVHAPTTLLAMVDSSLGSKVAVNHPRGKNLVGVFKDPTLVVADTAALATLPRAEFRAGLAEVVKAGVVGSAELFARLEESGTQDLHWIILEAMKVKIAVIEEDPYEGGRRAVLNLGHTFGHALEALSGYSMRHGEAVSVGMVVAAGVAGALGLCAIGLKARLMDLLQKLGLPTAYEGFSPEDIWQAMHLDKKRLGGHLRFALPKRIGEVIVTSDVPQEVILRVLAEARQC